MVQAGLPKLSLLLLQLLQLLLLLGAAPRPATAQPYTQQQEISSSLIVNQLAILKMMGDSSNSCSTIPPNIMEKLESQLLQDKQERNTTMIDVLEHLTAIKNETAFGFEDMKGEFRSLFEAYDEKVTVYKTQVDNITTQLAMSEEEQNNRLTETLEELGRVQSEQQEKLDTCRSEVNTLSKHITNLETQINRLVNMSEQWRPPPSTCTSRKVLTAVRGSIAVVEAGKYENNVDCEWTINLPAGTKISLKWNYIDMETKDNCPYDYVTVKNLITTQLAYGGKMCGPLLPNNLLIDSNNISIVFHSDGSNTGRGFELHYLGTV